MRLDRSDATSLTAIAVGGFVGLLGTGILVERIEDGFDDDVRIEHLVVDDFSVAVPRVRPTIDISRDGQRVRVRVDGPTSIGAPRRPAIYIDGVRVDAELMSIEDLDPTGIERIEVLKDLPGRDEVRIQTKPR